MLQLRSSMTMYGVSSINKLGYGYGRTFCSFRENEGEDVPAGGVTRKRILL